MKEVRRLLRLGGKAMITAQNKFHFMKLARSVEVAAFMQRGAEPACELAGVLEAEPLWSPSFAGTGRSLMALCSRA